MTSVTQEKGDKVMGTEKLKKKKKLRGLAGVLEALAPEYRFAVYKRRGAAKAPIKKRRGTPFLQGSFENGKRR